MALLSSPSALRLLLALAATAAAMHQTPSMAIVGMNLQHEQESASDVDIDVDQDAILQATALAPVAVADDASGRAAGHLPEAEARGMAAVAEAHEAAATGWLGRLANASSAWELPREAEKIMLTAVEHFVEATALAPEAAADNASIPAAGYSPEAEVRGVTAAAEAHEAAATGWLGRLANASSIWELPREAGEIMLTALEHFVEDSSGGSNTCVTEAVLAAASPGEFPACATDNCADPPTDCAAATSILSPEGCAGSCGAEDRALALGMLAIMGTIDCSCEAFHTGDGHYEDFGHSEATTLAPEAPTDDASGHAAGQPPEAEARGVTAAAEAHEAAATGWLGRLANVSSVWELPRAAEEIMLTAVEHFVEARADSFQATAQSIFDTNVTIVHEQGLAAIR